jgi:ubiquitin carboxyl-terminal hydrolase 7
LLYECSPTVFQNLLLTIDCSQVQAGGSFDVDFEVVGPNEKPIMDGTKERQGDFVFTATENGEYRFCFNNQMSTFAEKFVDFEIAVGVLPE